MVLSHSEQLECQAQRHFKREFLDMECKFKAVKVNPNPQKGDQKYSFSDKEYDGVLIKLTEFNNLEFIGKTKLKVGAGYNLIKLSLNKQ